MTDQEHARRVKELVTALKKARPFLSECNCAGSDGWKKIVRILEANDALIAKHSRTT